MHAPEPTTDDRYAKGRELVALSFPELHDDRAALARVTLGLLAQSAEQRREARAAHLLGGHELCDPEECRVGLGDGPTP